MHGGSTDRRRLAEMPFLHGNSPASPAGKFHEGKFILANVLGISLRVTAKTAHGFIATGVAQMSRFSSHSATIFTCIFHFLPPFIEK